MCSRQSFPEIYGNRYQWENTVLGYVAIFYNGAWLSTVATYTEALAYVKIHSGVTKSC